MPPTATYQLLSIQNPMPPKPNGTFRILHFSDIHLGLMPNPCECFNKRFFGAMNHLLRRRYKLHPEYIDALQQALPQLNPDLIVFTGDLASIATAREMDAAVSRLIPFRDYADFLFVPGNHDAYVRQALPFLDKAFQCLNKNRWQLQELPVKYECHGRQFCMINAAVPTLPWLSNGIITSKINEKISTLFSPSQDAIALCHFPAFNSKGKSTGWRHGLINENMLQNKLQNRTFAWLLSGHIHTPYSYVLPNHSVQICAGSLTLHGSFAIIDFI